MSDTTLRKAPKTQSRLEKLLNLERAIRYEQLGERDIEYRQSLEDLRQTVLSEIEKEMQDDNA